MNKKLLVGVDEITIVILPSYKMAILTWEKYAETIILHFVKITEIEKILNGKLEESDVKKMAGYDRNYNLGIKDYYFNIAYNTGNPNMGVCIRFSAKSWAIYQRQFEVMYNKRLLLPEFLKKLDANLEDQIRLSRIDLTADYFNCEVDLNKLNECLNSSEIIVQNDMGRSRIKNYESYNKNERVETIYIGSRKKNTNGFLRIYDKRTEQIKSNGFRLAEALANEEWIRFEAVFKGRYAHSIADTLIRVPMNEVEFTKYIAKTIVEKYRFYNVLKEQYTKFSRELLKVAEGCTCERLRSESPRDNALKQNIMHILHGSGLFPTIYKIENLYGKDAVENIISFLRMYYKNETWMSRTMYKELNIWLKKHESLKNVPFESNF